MSPLDRQNGRTHTVGRSVAAIAFAGALSVGACGAAAADPAPAPQTQAHKRKPASEASQAHAAKRRPVSVDIRGVSKPAYVVTKIVHLPSVAPHRTGASAHKVDAAAHRNEPPGHRPDRRAHQRPRSVVRCQQDDNDQHEDLGDDSDEAALTPSTQSGTRCPTNSRGGLDLSRLFD